VPSVLSAPLEDGEEKLAADEAADAAGLREDDDGRFAATVTAVAAAFGDPTRRDIFLHVRAHPGVTASEVAGVFSLHPNVARHHLDRLASAGYVVVEVERREQGAGRPSKCFYPAGDDLTIGFLNRRDDLLSLLLREAMELLGPAAAEEMAAKVGEEYGRKLAAQMSPVEGQRSVRAAMHAIAETLTAHGFAAHAEDRDATTAVVAEHCPFGDAATTNPVLCAVDRGMVAGLLSGLCGRVPEGGMPVVLTSRARGDDACAALA
jgi:predicted ArsR family transcriptional regulator